MANSGPLIARPRVAQVAGQRPQLALARRVDRDRRCRHRPDGLEGGDRVGRHRRLDVLDVVAEPGEQRTGLFPRGAHLRVEIGLDRRMGVPADPQPAGIALAPAEERLAGRQRRQQVGVAGHGDGDRVEERGGVAHRAGQRAEHAQPGGVDRPAGPCDTRPREVLRPTRPHTLAGMRIDPPPSLPWAIGTNPPATAAAAPPLDPPASRPVSHGVRAGGPMSVSV